MRRAVMSLCVLAALQSAFADDKLETGPVPSWVTPVAVPDDDGAGREAAVKFLLADQQASFSAGSVAVYSHSVMRVQTPQGLSSAGTISLPWNPATDSLTVHYLHILRGAQTIDVLAGGQSFTVLRRENSLEYAALNGVLTAVIQPPGLQIGDAVELAFTLTRSNPVFAGDSELVVSGWPTMPVERLSFRARWAAPNVLRWWASDVMPKLQETHRGETTEVSFELKDPPTLMPPKAAPARFRRGRELQFSTFKSWQRISAQFAPLYTQAARLGPRSPLRAEIEHIRATASDPGTRALAALALVQDQVRYVFLGMNEGALVPADADLTWSRRFGDCKGKTALLLALLRELGIEAEPVTVNILAGDAVKAGLPMIEAFNHVLVRATMQGKVYWLDGARTGDRQLTDLGAPPYHWGLPLTPEGSDLVQIAPAVPEQPLDDETFAIDASGGIPGSAPIHGEVVFRGQAGAVMRFALGNITPEERDKVMKMLWKKAFTDATVDRAEARFDEQSAQERLTMDGSLPLEWIGERLKLEGLTLSYNADFERPAGPHSDAPYVVQFPTYSRAVETIKLPRTPEPFTVVGEDIHRTLGGVEFTREVSVKDGVLTATTSARSLVTEIPFSAGAEAQQSLHKITDAVVYLQAPAGYVGQKSALKDPAVLDLPELVSLTTAQMTRGLIEHGNELLDKYKYDEAISEYDKALVLDSRSAPALAGRGMARMWTYESALAQQDFDSAAAIDPQNPIVSRGRGMLALHAGNPGEAVADFTESLKRQPGNIFSLGWRAEAYRRSGDYQKALDDSAAVIRLNPHYQREYAFRASVFFEQARMTEALQEADDVVAANAHDPSAYLMAAGIYRASGKDAEATSLIDHSLAVAPTAQAYLVRSEFRLKSDLSGRQADLEAALKLDPRSADAVVELAAVQSDAEKYDDAESTLTRGAADLGDLPELLTARGVLYAKTGQAQRGEKDFEAVRSKYTDPTNLNELCWTLATAGVALDTALRACNSALAQRPEEPSYLDSRGFVLLRLGRYDEAIASYDAALKTATLKGVSLFGRGVAKRRKGDLAGGDEDIRAALRLDAHVAATYADYGVEP